MANVRYNNGLCGTTVDPPPVDATNDPLPNIITPNGDALNQTFRLPPVCRVSRFFSRWGQPMFEAAGYHNDWAAEAQPSGINYFLLKYPDNHRVKGWLEVVK